VKLCLKACLLGNTWALRYIFLYKKNAVAGKLAIFNRPFQLNLRMEQATISMALFWLCLILQYDINIQTLKYPLIGVFF